MNTTPCRIMKDSIAIKISIKLYCEFANFQVKVNSILYFDVNLIQVKRMSSIWCETKIIWKGKIRYESLWCHIFEHECCINWCKLLIQPHKSLYKLIYFWWCNLCVVELHLWFVAWAVFILSKVDASGMIQDRVSVFMMWYNLDGS